MFGSRKTNIFKDAIDPSLINTVIHPSSSSDGCCAAWAAWKILGDKAEYISVDAGSSPPWDKVEGRYVAILEVSFKKEDVLKMLETCEGLVILAHRKATQEELKGIPVVYFDMERSGARLTWDYFHPNEQPPRYLEYIEDKELSRWRFVESKEFTFMLQDVPMTMVEYDKYADESNLRDLTEKGKCILKYVNTQVRRLACQAVIRVIKGKKLWVANSPLWQSELGVFLARKHGDADGALVWSYEDGDILCELRSVPGKADMSILAEKLNGGGQPQSSNFMWCHPLEELWDLVEQGT